MLVAAPAAAQFPIGDICGEDVDLCAPPRSACSASGFRITLIDVVFPAIGASCIDAGTAVTGSCSVGNFVLGDGACFGPGQGSQSYVAKCDNTPPPGGCLTRTAGFWGTQPHITAQFLPVCVCGVSLGTTEAGSGASATEALCVAGGVECESNTAYVQLVRQLAAAKLNLAATAVNGGTCGPAISELITKCELLCNANHKTISASGCIQLLDAFNNSVDTLTPTPPPFNNPGPAQPAACQAANGNGTVIGKPLWCK